MAHQHAGLGVPAGRQVAGEALEATLKQPQQTLVAVKTQIQPLLQWLQKHAKQLQGAGRWPLQQEDIPGELLMQWLLYQQHKAGLQSSKPHTGTAGQRRTGVPATDVNEAGHGIKTGAAHGNSAQSHVRAAAVPKLSSTILAPARTPSKAEAVSRQEHQLCLPATPVSATPATSARKARDPGPREVADTPTAARGLLQQVPDCIPATDERPEPSPSTAAQHAAAWQQDVPRRALFAGGSFAPCSPVVRRRPDAILSPPRPVLSRKAIPVPPSNHTTIPMTSYSHQGAVDQRHGGEGLAPAMLPLKPAPSFAVRQETLQAATNAAAGAAGSIQASHAVSMHVPTVLLPPGPPAAEHSNATVGMEQASSHQGQHGNGLMFPGGKGVLGSPVQGMAVGCSHPSAFAPLNSPPIRRRVLFRQGQSPNLRAAAVERQRCLTLTSPQHSAAGLRHHADCAPSPTASRLDPSSSGHGIADPLLSPPSYKQGRGNALMHAAMSPTMLHMPCYDISDVLLGSPSPWKGKPSTLLRQAGHQQPNDVVHPEPQAAASHQGQQSTGNILQMPQEHLQGIQHSAQATVVAGAGVLQQCEAGGQEQASDTAIEAAARHFPAPAVPVFVPTERAHLPGQQCVQPEQHAQLNSKIDDGTVHLPSRGISVASGAAKQRHPATQGAALGRKQASLSATAPAAARDAAVLPAAKRSNGRTTAMCKQGGNAAPAAPAPSALTAANKRAAKPAHKRRNAEYQPMAYWLCDPPSPARASAADAGVRAAQHGSMVESAATQGQSDTVLQSLQPMQALQQLLPAPASMAAVSGRTLRSSSLTCRQKVRPSKADAHEDDSDLNQPSSSEDDVWCPGAAGDGLRSRSGKRSQRLPRGESDDDSEPESGSEQDYGSEEVVGEKRGIRAARKAPAARKQSTAGVKRARAAVKHGKQVQAVQPLQMETEEVQHGMQSDDKLLISNVAHRKAAASETDMLLPVTKRARPNTVAPAKAASAIAAGDDKSAAIADDSIGASRAAAVDGKGAGQAVRRARKPAERKNFVKMNACANRGKFSFNFQSRSSAGGRLKASRTRLRRVNGKIVRMQFKAPAIAGRGGDVLEGFQTSTRCFLCGKTGHWAAQCPSHTGMAPEQQQMAEAEAADAAAAAGVKGIAARLMSPKKAGYTTQQSVTALAACEPGKSQTAGSSQVAGSTGSRRAGIPILRPGQSVMRVSNMGLGTPSQEPFQLQKLLPKPLAAELAPVLGWTVEDAAPDMSARDGQVTMETAAMQGVQEPVLLNSMLQQHATDATGQSRAGAPTMQTCVAGLHDSTTLMASMGHGEPGKDKGAVAGDPGASVAGHDAANAALSGVQPMSEAEALEAVGHKLTDAQLQSILQAVWGHKAFRGNQLPLIRAALQGRHVSGMLPTGAGKSLCYQLPALLLPGVTLVVSPLLALMRDQLLRLPKGVPGAMLWGGQTREEAEAVLKAASKGALKLLYIAPEKLHNPVVLDALKRLPQRLPLVCVDEAHCVSEWGHSFRPAYYRLGAVLRHVLRPRSLMALTATATYATAQDITTVLGLGQAEGQALHVRELPLRGNLRLHVVHINNGTASGRSCSWLLAQLQDGGQMGHVGRVIVYVAFQAQADEVAQRLTRSGVRAVAYHAGKDMNERTRVQEAFSAGGARVVVATVAFGMGVDQAEVGAVVHLQMPRSLEDYVQQVGRAGRDGSEAQCYLLLDSQDFLRLRSLMHSNACELAAVTSLLRHIFAPLQVAKGGLGGGDLAWYGSCMLQTWGGTLLWCIRNNSQEAQESSRPALPAAGSNARPCVCGVLGVKDACLELELDQEVMETCLSYLQGPDGRGLIATLPPTSTALDVRFHHLTPAQLAQRAPVIAALLATKPKVIKGIHKVSMAKLVAAAQLSSSAVLAQLSELARKQEIQYELGPARALAWRVVTQSMPDVNALASQLHARLIQQEQLNVRRLDSLYALMAGAARQGTQASQEAAVRSYVADYFSSADIMPAMPRLPDSPPLARTQELQELQPRDAVAGSNTSGPAQTLGSSAAAVTEAAVAAALEASGMWCNTSATDQESGGEPAEAAGVLPVVLQPGRLAIQVAAFLHSQQQQIMSQGRRIHGTAVARIFHGLSSPAWPSDQWRKCGFWARFTSWDFRAIVDAAGKQLPRFYAHQQQQQSHVYL